MNTSTETTERGKYPTFCPTWENQRHFILLFVQPAYIDNIVIPKSVTYNGKTYSVTAIGKYAFYYCSGLTSITIPNSVTSIGGSAFSHCSGLTELTIPNSVTEIGEYAFSNCSSLTELTIPNSVTSIGFVAFSDCSGLTKVNISDLAAWCKISFYNKYSNPLYFAHHLYLNGEEVKKLVIPSNVTSISNYAFSGCSGLTSLTIPNSVTSIGYAVFSGCSSLTELTIPNSVTFIGDDAFSGCSSLTELTIPNSVTAIGKYAFWDCSGLTELTIGNSVTSIDAFVFSGCSSLTSVTSLNTTPPNIFYSAFDSTTEQNATLHVPAGCKEVYQQAAHWQDFRYIQDDASTGIESIRVDKQEKTTIYTLDGKQLNTTNTADLPTGIYIINGKKVAVK